MKCIFTLFIFLLYISLVNAGCQLESIRAESWPHTYYGNQVSSDVNNIHLLNLRNNFLSPDFDSKFSNLITDLNVGKFRNKFEVIDRNLYLDYNGIIGFYDGLSWATSQIFESKDCNVFNVSNENLYRSAFDKYISHNWKFEAEFKDAFIYERNEQGLAPMHAGPTMRILNFINWLPFTEISTASQDWIEIDFDYNLFFYAENSYRKLFAKKVNEKTELMSINTIIYEEPVGGEYAIIILIFSEKRLLEYKTIDEDLEKIISIAPLAFLPYEYYRRSGDLANECHREVGYGGEDIEFVNRSYSYDSNTLAYYDNLIPFLIETQKEYVDKNEFCEEKQKALISLITDLNRTIEIYKNDKINLILSSLFPKYDDYSNFFANQAGNDLNSLNNAFNEIERVQTKFKERLDDFKYKQTDLRWKNNFDNWQQSQNESFFYFTIGLFVAIVLQIIKPLLTIINYMLKLIKSHLPPAKKMKYYAILVAIVSFVGFIIITIIGLFFPSGVQGILQQFLAMLITLALVAFEFARSIDSETIIRGEIKKCKKEIIKEVKAK